MPYLSTLKVYSGQGATQIHVYLTLLLTVSCRCSFCLWYAVIFMCLSAIVSREQYISNSSDFLAICLSIHYHLFHMTHVSLQLPQGFLWNLSQMFILWVGIAGEVLRSEVIARSNALYRLRGSHQLTTVRMLLACKYHAGARYPILSSTAIPILILGCTNFLYWKCNFVWGIGVCRLYMYAGYMQKNTV